VSLELPANSTVKHAITESFLLQKYSEIQPENMQVGIYGKIVQNTQRLQDQDRVEISFKVTAILVLYCSSVGWLLAGGMKVEPGMWETKSVVKSPGGTHENVSQDCIEESEISPERMMDDNTGCKVLESNANPKSMQWSIQCINEGVAMTGEGSAQSTGSSITGNMEIKASFSGQEFTMSTKWEGSRIGDCK
jgi:hypothetical protein